LRPGLCRGEDGGDVTGDVTVGVEGTCGLVAPEDRGGEDCFGGVMLAFLSRGRAEVRPMASGQTRMLDYQEAIAASQHGGTVNRRELAHVSTAAVDAVTSFYAIKEEVCAEESADGCAASGVRELKDGVVGGQGCLIRVSSHWSSCVSGFRLVIRPVHGTADQPAGCI
jgi:hypothetical protein